MDWAWYHYVLILAAVGLVVFLVWKKKNAGN